MSTAIEIREMEAAYQQLHGQLLRGELNEEDYRAQVELLRFEDDQGRQWRLGWYTGQWYRQENGQWVQDTPNEREVPGPAPMPASEPSNNGRTRSNRAWWLVLLLVSLLALAALMVFVGWGRILRANKGPTAETVAVVETEALTAIVDAPTDPPSAQTPLPTLTKSPRATPTPGRTPRPTVVRTTLAESPTEVLDVELSPAPTLTETPPVPTAAPTSEPTPTSSPAPTPEPPPQQSQPPLLTGHIFFPVYDSARSTFDIYAMDLESGERELVAEQASQPALSPDGKRLAYRSWDNARRGLLVRELVDNNTWLWINYGEAARPSWSPDSADILFPSQQESDRGWRLYRTWGLEFDRVRRHGGDIPGRVPAWMTDGRIVYWECPQNTCGLYVMQRDGTNPLLLTTSEKDTTPAPSPDSKRVAFSSARDGNWEVYVTDVEVAGGDDLESRRLTNHPARDGLPFWSPDGQWLAFASDREGGWAVWAMRPDGSDLRRLFVLGGPLEGGIAKVAPGDQHGWAWESLAWGP